MYPEVCALICCSNEYSDGRIDPTGEFTLRNQGWGVWRKRYSAEALIRKELATIRREVTTKGRALRYSSDVQIGLELMHLFVLDLLGRATPAAKIFQTKSMNELS